MYSRTIGDEEHTFGVSGKLIMNALVMYDHQTRTLWSQFLRKGVEGELKGVELDVIPVTQTTWATWKELHPDTKVMSTGGLGRYDNYNGYYMSNRNGVIGQSFEDDRLNNKQLVVGVDFNGVTKAYPTATLLNNPVVNDDVGGQPALVYMDGPTGTALVFDRTVDGRTLTFSIDGEENGIQTKLVDEETGTIWSAFSGLAVKGELSGTRLERLPSHLSFWFAWTDWYRDTELYTG